MSEFIVIAPSDYKRIDIDEWVEDNQQYHELNEVMANAGVMPEGVEGVTGLKLVEDRELYVKFD